MSGGGQAPQPYQPPNQAGAAAGQQAGTNALAQGGSQIQATAMPGFQQLYQGAQQNPYYAGAQASAGNVAQAGQNFANTSTANAGALNNLGTSLGQYAQPIAQTAFDPQGAIYNQLQQQNTDQTAAINSMYGVGGSPYGAGLGAQSNQNLNLAWQQGAAQRANQGIAALQGLANTQGGLYGQAQNLQGQGINTLATTGQMPTQVYQQQQQAIQQALNALVGGDTSAYNLTQQSVGDEGSYLGIGQQASAGALNAWKAQQQADNQLWSSLGSVLGIGGQLALGAATGGLSLGASGMVDASGLSSMIQPGLSGIPTPTLGF